MKVNPAHLRRIKETFPRLEIASLRSVADGLTNDVLIVNEDLVFRFPKNETWARELLANEIRVIELLRRRVKIPLPQFELVAEDLSAHRFIKGDALRREDVWRLKEKERTRIAQELAEFLRQMHSVPAAEIRRKKIAASDTNRSRETWLKLFENVKKNLFPLMMPHVRESVAEHFTPVIADENFMRCEPRLMNGDFVPYHILFDREANRINGIIDFGTAGTGDVAGDYACVIYNYGESFLRRMKRVYPEISAGVDRARFWAGTLPLQWALSGRRSKNVWWHLVSMSGARDAQAVGAKF